MNTKLKSDFDWNLSFLSMFTTNTCTIPLVCRCARIFEQLIEHFQLIMIQPRESPPGSTITIIETLQFLEKTFVAPSKIPSPGQLMTGPLLKFAAECHIWESLNQFTISDANSKASSLHTSNKCTMHALMHPILLARI